MRLFPYLCCRYYFYFCPPSHKASNLERVRDWHSFRSSTTLTMLFKKTYDYDYVHAYASASVKSVVIILWLRDDTLNIDKKFLAFIFNQSVTGLLISPAQPSRLHEIQNTIACRTGIILRRFLRQTEALKSIPFCSLIMSIPSSVGLHPYLHYLI